MGKYVPCICEALRFHPWTHITQHHIHMLASTGLLTFPGCGQSPSPDSLSPEFEFFFFLFLSLGLALIQQCWGCSELVVGVNEASRDHVLQGTNLGFLHAKCWPQPFISQLLAPFLATQGWSQGNTSVSACQMLLRPTLSIFSLSRKLSENLPPDRQ